jgi:hypothetical protein
LAQRTEAERGYALPGYGTRTTPPDAQDDPSDARTCYHQHRDFVLFPSDVMLLAARLWLQGWLEGIAQGGWDAEDISS